MQVDICRHIKTNGLQCRAVALCGSVFCYFHNRLHRSHDRYRDKPYLYPHRVDTGTYIELPELEDCESIQIAISSVVNALATDCITERRAFALIQGLYLASTNARRMRGVRHPTQVVRDFCKEQESPLPEGSPNIALPGRTCEIDDPAEMSEESSEPRKDSAEPRREASPQLTASHEERTPHTTHPASDTEEPATASALSLCAAAAPLQPLPLAPTSNPTPRTSIRKPRACTAPPRYNQQNPRQSASQRKTNCEQPTTSANDHHPDPGSPYLRRCPPRPRVQRSRSHPGQHPDAPNP